MSSLRSGMILILLVFLSALASGCATSGDMMKSVVGVSTASIEEARKDALVKVFDYDYDTCYENTEKLLRQMPKISVYAQDDEMIAVFWTYINTTPVGIFFTEVDAKHTRVEVASPSTTGKEWVAKNLFEEKILKPPPAQEYF